MSSSLSHLIARTSLFSEVDSAKINGVRTGYSPLHRFAAVPYFISGRHTYSDDTIHYPGESLLIGISFPSWQYVSSLIKVGDRFDICELYDVVGEGVVVSIGTL